MGGYNIADIISVVDSFSPHPLLFRSPTHRPEACREEEQLKGRLGQRGDILLIFINNLLNNKNLKFDL